MHKIKFWAFEIMSKLSYEKLKLSRQLCFPLYVCSKEVVKSYKPYLDPLGLTYTQYIVMMALWEKEEMTVSQLGQDLYLDSGTLTPLLKKLEQKGLVTRRRAAEDERVVFVAITEEGMKLREEAVHIPDKMISCLPISMKDAMTLYRILHKMMDSYQK